MLPRYARLTSPNDFARTTKSGLRLTNKSLVLYFHATNVSEPARFGLIIGKSVGGSVVRHHIARKIRHVLATYILDFPQGSLVVVRALPRSAQISHLELQHELEFLIAKVRGRKEIPV